MKTKFLPFVIVIILVLLIDQNGVAHEKQPQKGVRDTIGIKYSPNVLSIVNNKCYQCHNPEARSEKSKNKLNFESLSTLTKAGKIAKFDKIVDVMDSASMPPKKFLERFPNAKMTDDERSIIKNWAQISSDMIMKKP
jgi:uncharacterized membrane protein